MPQHIVVHYAMAFSSTDAAYVFFDHLVRCETRLYNAVGERLRSDHGITTAEFEYLRYLRDHPESRVVEIAVAFAAGVGAISKLTDRLSARGWVRRTANPADGRSSLIGLTTTGTDLVMAADRSFKLALDELVGQGIAPQRLADTSTTLAALREVLEENRIGTPVG